MRDAEAPPPSGRRAVRHRKADLKHFRNKSRPGLPSPALVALRPLPPLPRLFAHLTLAPGVAGFFPIPTPGISRLGTCGVRGVRVSPLTPPPRKSQCEQRATESRLGLAGTGAALPSAQAR